MSSSGCCPLTLKLDVSHNYQLIVSIVKSRTDHFSPVGATEMANNFPLAVRGLEKKLVWLDS